MTEINRLLAAISAIGLPPPTEQQLVAAINNKKPAKWSTNGRKSDQAGWCYVRDINGILSANFGCWRSIVKDYWSSKSRNDMSEVDYQTHIHHRDQYFKKLQEDAEFKASEAAIRS